MSDPAPEPLILPEGVRPARPDELPRNLSADVLGKLASRRLMTGFVLHKHPLDDGFTTFSEANVHASRLWETFKSLADALLPEMAAPIVGVKDEEPILGPYTDRTRAVAVFEPYAHALCNDGLLEFGIIFQQRGRTEEVFVKSPKYLQVWTSQPRRLAEVLTRCGVPAVDHLHFIDELPHVSYSPGDSSGNAGWPYVIESLRSAFATLPGR